MEPKTIMSVVEMLPARDTMWDRAGYWACFPILSSRPRWYDRRWARRRAKLEYDCWSMFSRAGRDVGFAEDYDAALKLIRVDEIDTLGTEPDVLFSTFEDDLDGWLVVTFSSATRPSGKRYLIQRHDLLSLQEVNDFLEKGRAAIAPEGAASTTP